MTNDQRSAISVWYLVFGDWCSVATRKRKSFSFFLASWKAFVYGQTKHQCLTPVVSVTHKIITCHCTTYFPFYLSPFIFLFSNHPPCPCGLVDQLPTERFFKTNQSTYTYCGALPLRFVSYITICV